MTHRLIHRRDPILLPRSPWGALRTLGVAMAAWGAMSAAAGPGQAGEPLAHTYSIVARDATTGQLGVAVQSHWFQVGTVVTWARAGVGAVATQSFTEVDYGPKGLDLMEAGQSAPAALASLLEADENRQVRQVAMVDVEGKIGVHTGSRCIAHAGHLAGKGYSVQANLMAWPSVWPAMAGAYEAAEGDLAERMLAALEAAEAEGGDVRGRQSAALLIVEGQASDRPWRDVVVDLRVDDHPAPLEELRRLLRVHRAYVAMNQGDVALAEGRMDEAAGHYSRGVELLPDQPELPFWQAITLWTSGQTEAAGPILEDLLARDDRWRELVRRLPAAELLSEEAAQEILALAPAEPAVGPEGEEADDREGDAEVRVRGTLTDDGIECPALRDENGELWTLAGNLRGFEVGDEVVVEGEVARFSICMQGTTLNLRSIRAAEAPPTM